MNALQAHDQARLKTAGRLIGVDEAGRGCLAGPVVAGACVVSRELFADGEALRQSARINDSKQLSAAARAAQFAVLADLQARGLIDFAVSMGSVEEIARHNILGATRLAMQRAVEALAERATAAWALPHEAADEPLFQREGGVCILVDGRPLKPYPYAHEGVVKGDGRSLCIAMASIAAKVTRDHEMRRLGKVYAAYGFEQHKGYGTPAHRAAIRKHGPCAIHRDLFLRKLLLP
ncbi:MAG: ribonuclease HII [Verrucomicrobia bacterium]|jgi:ribonuclease HII|nr:ribonuclease HII [Verrucomicrobiota bacterium]